MSETGVQHLVGQVIGHLTLQTAVHCDASLVLDTFRNVRLVQIVMQESGSLRKLIRELELSVVVFREIELEL